MREFVTWAEAVAALNTDDEGLRQALALGLWETLRAYLRASERAFLAELDNEGIAYVEDEHGGLTPRVSWWNSDEPLYLEDGRTLDAWHFGDNYCNCEKQESPTDSTGYPAVYLLDGFLCVHPLSIRRAAENGYFDGIAVSPPSWWKRPSPVPLTEAGRPKVHFFLLDRGETLGHRTPPRELQTLWFRAEDVERLKSPQPQTRATTHVTRDRPMDKPLDIRERATLLCIIGALAANAKLDLSQPMKAGEAIAAMMPDVKLSPRTIGEHLKAVRDAMDSRKG